MPTNVERRNLIADCAIEILAEAGARGLTHRVVDRKAMLPPGTTSNFFRTRLALLQAATNRVAEQHWRQVADLQAATAGPPNRATTVALLGRLLSMQDAETRTRHLARFELFLEGTRCAEL